VSNGNLNWIANFIWGIADDVLRDAYVRGKYRDVILPMMVIRRLDAVLEPTKPAVLTMKKQLDAVAITHQDAALQQASRQAFYNTSAFTLRDLRARAKMQQLRADFEAYFEGFSPNVQEILDKFKFHHQIPTLIGADILGSLIEKFLDPAINLTPNPMLNNDGSIRLPALDNHAMGTIFEELIRRYNTGIATYIWVLTNRKPVHRQCKVQLIDATEWFKPLRKNLGKKNCELSPDDIRSIVEVFLAFEETEQSKIFLNAAFGYWKITVERPLRLRVDLTDGACTRFRKTCKDANEKPLADSWIVSRLPLEPAHTWTSMPS